MKVQNPIIRGFYPDPSICKANGKYYMACSSFQYFPGVPIFESVDLVNWTQIGHCITRESQTKLERVPSSGGVFAPTLRFHEGTFYMVTNNNTWQKNFYMSTTDIYGEWSEPIFVDQEGIDPSLLFDEGKVYFTTNGNDAEGKQCVLQCEIDIATGKKLTDSMPIWPGSGGRYLESPHLYHIGEWYYLMAAEGGTEYGHMVTYARSKAPFGPFEGYAKNPVLTNRNFGGNVSQIQGIGHGDLICDDEGRYFIVCLGFRQSGEWQPFHHLGREVFLAPIQWNDQGWFTAGDQGSVQEWMEIETTATKQNLSYDVDLNKMPLENLRWCYLRNLQKENYCWEQGVLTITGTKITLDETDAPSFIGIRQSEFDTKLQVTVTGDAETAGVSFYMDESQHYDLAVVQKEGQKEVMLRVRIGDACQIVNSIPVSEAAVKLEVISTPEFYEFYCNAGQTKQYLGKARTKYLSSEVAGGFTGVVMGMYVVDGQGRSASFSDMTWSMESK